MASRQAQRWRNGDDGPVGLVVAGGGARGAYETGVLSVLLPELARQGRRPTVFVGTSAGAINAALFASLAHLPTEEAAGVALDRWRSVHQQMVIKPAWQTLPPLGLRYAAAMVGVPGQLTGLLDTGPLASSLNRNQLIDWGRSASSSRRSWTPRSSSAGGTPRRSSGSRRCGRRPSSRPNRSPVRPSALSMRLGFPLGDLAVCHEYR
jgi:Patatin-like phospholipase